MSRGGTSKQNQTYNQSQQVGNTAQTNQNALAATLTPMYQDEAVNPQGFGSDLPGINTAAQQSTGGALAAQKGDAALQAARSRNRGSSQVAEDESVRNAMRTNSQNALNVGKANAELKQNQSQAGISGLQGLYGSNVQELLGSMGIGTQIANNQASQPGWFQNMTGLISSLAGAGAKTASGGFTL